MPASPARRLAAALCLLAIAVVAPASTGQAITYDGDESITADLANEMSDLEAGLIVLHLTTWLGPPSKTSESPAGEGVDISPCPPPGTVVGPVDVEVVADASPDGPNIVIATFEYSIVEPDCTLRPMVLRYTWEQVPFAAMHTTFIVLPPLPIPSLPPPPPPADPEPPTGGSGYSAQYIAMEDNVGADPPCHVIEVVVTPWGEVLSGAAFAERHPEHVQAFLHNLQVRTGTPFTTDCVEFGSH